MKAILTGATGMVGEGVLMECLNHADITEVLVINRKPCKVVHPKLKEIIHANFFNLSAIENQLAGYNACFFCLGVSSIGMKELEYKHLTYDLTLNFAQTLVKLNPEMIFTYISGASTDSSEQGRMMWARVKGKTENDLLKLPFKAAYMFRPGALKPSEGAKNVLSYYKYFGWLFPIIRFLFPNSACTLKELGLAMINVVLNGCQNTVLEVKDIVKLAKE